MSNPPATMLWRRERFTISAEGTANTRVHSGKGKSVLEVGPQRPAEVWIELFSPLNFLKDKSFSCVCSRWLLCQTGTLAATTAQPGTTSASDTRNSFWLRRVSVHPLPFGPFSRDNEIDNFILISLNAWSQGSCTFWITAHTVTQTVHLLCSSASLLTVIALFAILREINFATTPNPYSAYPNLK